MLYTPSGRLPRRTRAAPSVPRWCPAPAAAAAAAPPPATVPVGCHHAASWGATWRHATSTHVVGPDALHTAHNAPTHWHCTLCTTAPYALTLVARQVGGMMSEFPLDPQLAKMLVAAPEFRSGRARTSGRRRLCLRATSLGSPAQGSAGQPDACRALCFGAAAHAAALSLVQQHGLHCRLLRGCSHCCRTYTLACAHHCCTFRCSPPRCPAAGGVIRHDDGAVLTAHAALDGDTPGPAVMAMPATATAPNPQMPRPTTPTTTPSPLPPPWAATTTTRPPPLRPPPPPLQVLQRDPVHRRHAVLAQRVPAAA